MILVSFMNLTKNNFVIHASKRKNLLCLINRRFPFSFFVFFVIICYFVFQSCCFSFNATFGPTVAWNTQKRNNNIMIVATSNRRTRRKKII